MPHRKRPDLDPATEALITEINTAIATTAAALQALSKQRLAIFRDLRGKGWKISHLAQLAEISPQRMSKILSAKPSKPLDGWG